jgi:ribosomal protein S18 acetylase RimI-like enzyme
LGDPAARGRGIGRAVEYLVQHHVFEIRRMAKLSCEVLAFNTQVLEMHQKLGFTREAVLREHVARRDGRHDVHVLGMLQREWLGLRDVLRQGLEMRGIVVEPSQAGGTDSRPAGNPLSPVDDDSEDAAMDMGSRR